MPPPKGRITKPAGGQNKSTGGIRRTFPNNHQPSNNNGNNSINKKPRQSAADVSLQPSLASIPVAAPKSTPIITHNQPPTTTISAPELSVGRPSKQVSDPTPNSTDETLTPTATASTLLTVTPIPAPTTATSNAISESKPTFNKPKIAGLQALKGKLVFDAAKLQQTLAKTAPVGTTVSHQKSPSSPPVVVEKNDDNTTSQNATPPQITTSEKPKIDPQAIKSKLSANALPFIPTKTSSVNQSVPDVKPLTATTTTITPSTVPAQTTTTTTAVASISNDSDMTDSIQESTPAIANVIKSPLESLTTLSVPTKPAATLSRAPPPVSTSATVVLKSGSTPAHIGATAATTTTTPAATATELKTPLAKTGHTTPLPVAISKTSQTLTTSGVSSSNQKNVVSSVTKPQPTQQQPGVPPQSVQKPAAHNPTPQKRSLPNESPAPTKSTITPRPISTQTTSIVSHEQIAHQTISEQIKASPTIFDPEYLNERFYCIGQRHEQQAQQLLEAFTALQHAQQQTNQLLVQLENFLK